MTVPRLNLNRLEADLPRAVRVGRRLSISALALALVALIGVGVLAARKADRASADAEAARRSTALVVCALANAQRTGNPSAPPASTARGAYVADIWAAAFRVFGCSVFTLEELATLGGAITTPPAENTPDLSPSTSDTTPGG